MKIPSFEGRTDPEVYLEWEKKITSCLIVTITLKRRK